MPSKKYQIFISSTFRDLKDERRQVLEAILHLRHIPAGMELFPSAHGTPWDVIKDVIASCDYFLLFIGGRYGSLDEDGLSYTEKEYEFAREIGKYIIPFVHGDPEGIQVRDSEQSEDGRKRLAAFREKVRKRHLCQEWRLSDELKSKVVQSLACAIADHPQVGWVRADGYDNNELLVKVEKLREENETLRREIARRDQAQAMTDMPNLASGNEKLACHLEIHPHMGPSNFRPYYEFDHGDLFVDLSWDEIFFGISDFVLLGAEHRSVLIQIKRCLLVAAVAQSCEDMDEPMQDLVVCWHMDCASVVEDTTRAIVTQLLAANLVEVDSSFVWKLTNKGRVKHFERHAMHRSQ